jgi:hypothetical protein
MRLITIGRQRKRRKRRRRRRRITLVCHFLSFA